MRELFNNRVIAVIKREIKAQATSKAFIFMTIFMPVLMIGLGALQYFVLSGAGEKSASVQIVSNNSTFLTLLEKELNEKNDSTDVSYQFDFYQLTEDQDIKDYISKKKEHILDESLDGILHVNVSDSATKVLSYYSKNPNNNNLNFKVRGPVNKVLVTMYFDGKDISEEDLSFARARTHFTGFRISEDEKIEEEGIGAGIVAGAFTFFLYLSLMLIGMQLLRVVIEEKTTRVVEVLLSSVSSKELMTGKIIGTTATGLIQMTVWTFPIIVAGMSGFIASKLGHFEISVSFGQMLYFFTNYIIGLTTYLGLFAAMGSIFDNDQDAQQGVMPLMMLIMIPFYICFSLFRDPSNSIAEISSMLPFLSIIVMPARMAMIDIPAWQILVALVSNIGTLLFIFTFVGKVYRVGILMTGKKPKWSEVYRWIKES